MPGKIKTRLIKGILPKSKYWIPNEIDNSTGEESELSIISISVAEWETLRLCDLERYKQRDVAQIMHLSQPTVNRLLTKAHLKIAEALFNGKTLKFETDMIQCPKCKERLATKLGNPSNIICPACKQKFDLV